MAIEYAVVEPQMVTSSCEPDILFVKNCSPLHGRAVQYLAIAAMTNLGVDRIGADFVSYRTAMAAGSILRNEVLVVR